MDKTFLLRLNKKTKPLNIWHSKKENYADYLIQNYSIEKFLKNSLKDKFNSVEIKRGSFGIDILVYINPDFHLRNEPIDVSALSKIIKSGLFTQNSDNLNCNINIYILKSGEIGFNRFNSIRTINFHDTRKSSKIVSDYISYKVVTDIKDKRFLKKLELNIKDAMSNSKNTIKGYRIECSGPFKKSSMARKIIIREGNVPLNTLNANIVYSMSVAHTIYGSVGVKVWIHFE